mgnify:CR=1 FL=1
MGWCENPFSHPLRGNPFPRPARRTILSVMTCYEADENLPYFRTITILDWPGGPSIACDGWGRDLVRVKA